jgi:periplasmic nitrate reductase NapD
MHDAPLSRRDLLTGHVLASSESQEIHLSSLVVHVRPETLDDVRGALRAMPGVEIHGENAAGKIVITVETRTEHEVVQRLGAISELPGVLSAALVYHHFEASSSASA